MTVVVVDLLLGGREHGRGCPGFAGAGVAGIAREGPAGHLDSDAVTAPEAVGRRPQLHSRAGNLVSGRDADESIAHVVRASAGVYVAEPDEDVGA